MKLWHVIQYGNWKSQDGNKEDTNCLVASDDMNEAIELAEHEFKFFAIKPWRDGKASVIHLLGETQTSKSQVVILPWIQHGFNRGKFQAWHRVNDTGLWLTSEEFFDEYIKSDSHTVNNHE